MRPMIIQRIAPPKTSEAVTGAASLIRWLTLWLVAKDSPRSWWITSCLTNFQYWTGIGWSRPSFAVARTRHSRLACSPPQTARAGLFGPTKKITNVTNVITMKRRIAQSVRLTRYRNTLPLLSSLGVLPRRGNPSRNRDCETT